MGKHKRKLLNLLALPIFLLGCKNGTKIDDGNKEIEYFNGTYENPIEIYDKNLNPYKAEMADPSVVRGDDGKIYAFGTNRASFYSEDGCSFFELDYQIINWPTWQNEVIPDTVFYMYAPDVIKVNKQWIYYYSFGNGGSSTPGIGFGVSSKCEGPYEDRGCLFTYEQIGDVRGVIDQQVFYDKDGNLHLVYGNFLGIYVVDLESDGMSLKKNSSDGKGNKTLIAGHSRERDTSTYEGPFIIYKDGYYYLFASTNPSVRHKDSKYKVMVGRSQNYNGPYLDKEGHDLKESGDGTCYGNLVIESPEENMEFVAGPGHNGIFIDDAGDYWLYYHAYTNKDNFAVRHLMMDKLLWDEDGFPYVENYRPTFDETKIGPSLI